LHRIQRNDLIYQTRRSPALVVAYLLTGIGAIAFFSVLLAPLLA
jgi:putative membrane protein